MWQSRPCLTGLVAISARIGCSVVCKVFACVRARALTRVYVRARFVRAWVHVGVAEGEGAVGTGRRVTADHRSPVETCRN